MQAPPNYQETERRFRDAVEEFSSGSRLQLFLADLMVVNGEPTDVLSLVEMLDRELRLAVLWAKNASTHELLGADADEMACLKKCANISPSDQCLLALDILQARGPTLRS